MQKNMELSPSGAQKIHRCSKKNKTAGKTLQSLILRVFLILQKYKPQPWPKEEEQLPIMAIIELRAFLN